MIGIPDLSIHASDCRRDLSSGELRIGGIVLIRRIESIGEGTDDVAEIEHRRGRPCLTDREDGRKCLARKAVHVSALCSVLASITIESKHQEDKSMTAMNEARRVLQSFRIEDEGEILRRPKETDRSESRSAETEPS
jgi:hypothetical protein